MGQLRGRAIAQVPQLRLVAVADLRKELAQKAAATASGVRLYADGAALIKDPEVDAVILSTPPASHEPLGQACLAAGKHLLCEKPLANTPDACEVLVQAAEKAGVSLATGFNCRYTRAALLARQLLEKGAIGQLDHIRAYHGFSGGQETTQPWVYNPSASGGGTLMDNGIHLIDLTRWFLGDVQRVTGYATNHTWHKPACDDNGFLLLINSKGCVASLQASWTEWRGYQYRMEIYGTEGFIRFGYPPLYLIHGRRKAGGGVRIKRHLFPLYQVFERMRGWEWGLIETLVRELKAWGQAIATDSPQPISGYDGWEAVRIARAAAVGESCPQELALV